MTCKVCNGTGKMTYPHPDDEGGMTTAVAPYVKDGDGAPEIVRKYVKVEAQP